MIDCNLANEVLDSLQHLPEVIKPEHIKVNITRSNHMSNIVPPKEKDNIYHRTIVKSKKISSLNFFRGYSSKLKFEQAKNVTFL
jgi:hypothetical protein